LASIAINWSLGSMLPVTVCLRLQTLLLPALSIVVWSHHSGLIFKVW
jgi:hypothetical protein